MKSIQTFHEDTGRVSQYHNKIKKSTDKYHVFGSSKFETIFIHKIGPLVWNFKGGMYVRRGHETNTLLVSDSYGQLRLKESGAIKLFRKLTSQNKQFNLVSSLQIWNSIFKCRYLYTYELAIGGNRNSHTISETLVRISKSIESPRTKTIYFTFYFPSTRKIRDS
jgi:hypothetical protein